MKNYKRIIAAMLILLLLSTAGCQKTENIQPDDSKAGDKQKNSLLINENEMNLSDFTVTATLLPDEKTLKVTESIDYMNPGESELNEVYFNIVADYFTKDGAGVAVKSISFDGNESKLEKVDGTVFKAKTTNPIEKQKRTLISLEYDVKIPDIVNRFGYADGYFNLGNFIITPAVYLDNKYTVLPYVDVGDAFYTDVANYDVEINVPEDFTVAATGQKGKDGIFHAKKVRDFAFCASNKYQILTDTVNDISVTVYFGEELQLSAKRALDVTKKSITLFSEKFGDYPYENLSVVMNGLTSGVGGMEYPTLIMVSPDVSIDELVQMGLDVEKDSDAVITVLPIDNSVCHEVAHQWFYGIVGNDQINEPWLDEGFCRFCEFVYQKEYPPVAVKDIEAYLTETHLKNNKYQADLTKSLYDWAKGDSIDYTEVYYTGADLLYDIYNVMGEESFYKAAKEYVEEFKYGFVSTKDFKQFWLERANVSDIINEYL